MQLLFVYGTLKQAQRLDAVLDTVSRWRVIREASVQGRLYDTGKYPALVLSDVSQDRIPGVLLALDAAVPALARLDAYEGVDEGLYERCCVAARLADGSVWDCWVYVYARSVERLTRIAEWPPP